MLTPPLHTCKPSPKRWLNRTYTLVYTVAILALFYRHCCNLIYSPSLTTISLFIADLVLAFLWATWQAFFLNPVHHRVFPANLPQVAKESEYPGLDVFVCTADPYKEPPVGVVNTALSVMAYEYPPEKLSVYVSDDGGSQLTLFAFMEGAKFARHWLPYCRKYDIMDRSPEVYFKNEPCLLPETDEMKTKYENMKARIHDVINRGNVDPNQITDDRSIKAFSKWGSGFTSQHHPTVIEVLLESSKDKDVMGHVMPNLIYLSREKNKATPHNFKAGALNALIRVSTVMTNSPIVLVLDCDMYSNDPKTPLRTLCYFMDPNIDPKLAFIQFPQRFHNINKNDTYGSEYLLETRVCSLGTDGLVGSIFVGTGAFFRRQAFLENPTKAQHVTNKANEYEDVLALAHHVASCSYEENTKWGHEIGFRYGTLVEDVFTSFRLHCLGWKSIGCNPNRAAFLGNMPTNLNDILSQSKRWYMGFLQVAFSKFSPITFGIKSMNPLQALCYTHYYFRSLWSIPVIVYALLPQLALVNSSPVFPKVSDPWFSLYAFLFLGAYGKDLLDYMMAGSMFQRWWSHQRMWLIMGCSSYPFSSFDWLLTSLGMSTFEFNVTSKVLDKDLSKRYNEGVFEFGVDTPLFLSLSIVAVVNLFAFLTGIIQILIKNERLEELFVQLFITAFAVVNSWPLYEAMALRSDKGKIPMSVTLKSIGIAFVICTMFYLAF